MAVQPSVETWAVFFLFHLHIYLVLLASITLLRLFVVHTTTCLYGKKIRFSVVIPDNLLIHYDWKTKIFLDQEIPLSLLFSTTENDSYYYR